MFDEALLDNFAQFRYQAFLDKQWIEFAFFGIDQKASDSFKQKCKHFFEVNWTGSAIFTQHNLKDFEEQMDVARWNLERHLRTLNCKQGKTAF